MGPGMEGARHALGLTAGVRWRPASPQKGVGRAGAQAARTTATGSPLLRVHRDRETCPV